MLGPGTVLDMDSNEEEAPFLMQFTSPNNCMNTAILGQGISSFVNKQYHKTLKRRSTIFLLCKNSLSQKAFREHPCSTVRRVVKSSVEQIIIPVKSLPHKYKISFQTFCGRETFWSKLETIPGQQASLNKINTTFQALHTR